MALWLASVFLSLLSQKDAAIIIVTYSTDYCTDYCYFSYIIILKFAHLQTYG